MNSIKHIPARVAPAVGPARENNKFTRVSGLIFTLAAAAAMSVTVSGCRQLDPPPPNYVFANPDIRFPIKVSSEVVSIEVPVAANKDGFAGLTRSEISRFLTGYRQSGRGELLLAAPPSRSRSPLMASTIDELWDVFEREGVSTDNVRIHDPGNSYASRPWITLTYYKDIAIAQPCGIWEHNVADDRGNIPYDNFGCTQQNNLAAMIAYPSDLNGNSAMSDRSNNRRAQVWKKYVAGTLDDKKKKTGKKSMSKP